MSLSDLVQAKKTQRDKKGPMIRRLIEADRVACQGMPSPKQALCWLREGRTLELLVEFVAYATRGKQRRRPLHFCRYRTPRDAGYVAGGEPSLPA